jgi:hypothetical protein
MNEQRSERYVINLEQALHYYRRSAPSILRSYVDFKDYVDIIVNTESAPFYSEHVTTTIYDIIAKGHQEPTELQNNCAEIMEMVELFTDGFVNYVDSILHDTVINNHHDTDFNSYFIETWLDGISPILNVRS